MPFSQCSQVKCASGPERTPSDRVPVYTHLPRWSSDLWKTDCSTSPFSGPPHECLTQSCLVVWWLILCLNLTGLRDAQVTGNTLFLGLFVGVFLEESRIWFSKLRRSVLRCGWTSSTCWGAPIGTKRWRKGKLSLFLSWDIHLFLPSDSGAPGCPAFRLQDLHPRGLSILSPLDLKWIIYHLLLWFSSLKTAY